MGGSGPFLIPDHTLKRNAASDQAGITILIPQLDLACYVI